MATVTTTRANGSLASASKAISTAKPTMMRFSDIPSSIAIPVGVGAGAQEEEVEIDVADLPDEPDELCTLLESEGAKKQIWMTIASAYSKQGKPDVALEILNRGLAVLSRVAPKDRAPLSTLQCWLYIDKARLAPRVEADGPASVEAKTKAYYLHQATAALNEASRVNPAFPPLVMARGVLSLLRAALQPPAKIVGPNQLEQSERVDTLKAALKSFDDAARMSAGRNVMAVLGRARALFALNKFAESLQAYQDVLAKMPDLIEPDPRVGIGCCLWRLNYTEEARAAWERALEMNPSSKIANILLGLYYLRDSSKYDPTSPEFAVPYGKAMGQFVSKAYELDPDYPLTCATMGGHYMPKLAMATVESLARKAVDLADANFVISDGWYLLARKEHFKQDSANLKKLLDLYGRADAARGGGARGFLLAKFGAAQTQILQNDLEGACYRLEGIVQHHQNVIEAKAILGTIYAQEYLDNLLSGGREDKTEAYKKAVSHLEAVRQAWKDSKRGLQPDLNVLVQLSKLYATDSPDKALQCLLQLQSWELERLPESLKYLDEADEALRLSRQRENLAPELLNNIACFQYQLERHAEATETFQIALSACTKVFAESGFNTDELVATISYNLARSYEGSQMHEEARKVYEGLLERHPEYSDAKTRLAYLKFLEDPAEEGQQAMADLFETDSGDLEVRALYGWFLRRTKKRVANLAEDAEYKHYRSTLKDFDSHDTYTLVGMGNLHLQLAREMKRESESDKEKRNSQYRRAVDFYRKALDLDPRNAYAAQGIGIALAETVRDLGAAKQIFAKVRETLKDANVVINLGHIDADLKQFSKAIEAYETALKKDRQEDTTLLSCLGRVYLNKARTEKSSKDMYTALSTAEHCLSLSPNQVHFQFNVAFVQHELGRLLTTLKENQRTLSEMEEAAKGLENANVAFAEIAKSPHPPYPKYDLEQRAAFGKTTLNQLQRAIGTQREYEEANASRLAAAREQREQQLREREDARKAAEEAEAERKQKLQEERARILETNAQLNEKRNEEIRRMEEAEWTENSDGEKVKRKSRKKGKSDGRRRKREDGDSGVEDSAEETGEEGAGGKSKKSRRKGARSATPGDGEPAPTKKKRKLERKGRESAAKAAKFKSSEFVEDSDEDDVAVGGGETGSSSRRDPFAPDDSDEEGGAVRDENGDVDMRDTDGDDNDNERTAAREGKGSEDNEGSESDTVRAPPRKGGHQVIDDDDDDDDGGDGGDDDDDDE